MSSMPPPVPPAMTPPAATGAVAASAAGVVNESRPCTRCSYDIKGLPLSGACPECGSPVADSMKGILLQYASPEYIRTVRSGHSLVLNGILLSIVLGILAFIAAAAFAGMAAATAPPVTTTTPSGSTTTMTMTTTFGEKHVELLADLIMLAVYIVVFVGYLRATEPDPGFVGIEKPDAARKVVRFAVIGQMCLQVVTIAVAFVAAGGSAMASSLPSTLILGGLSLVSSGLWAVQFFAMMRYTRWLGERVPDSYIVKRTRTYMWLLPVLTTVGVVFLAIGPLVALVLYWNLLDRMRKHLKSIETTGEPARLPKMYA